MFQKKNQSNKQTKTNVMHYYIIIINFIIKKLKKYFGKLFLIVNEKVLIEFICGARAFFLLSY